MECKKINDKFRRQIAGVECSVVGFSSYYVLQKIYISIYKTCRKYSTGNKSKRCIRLVNTHKKSIRGYYSITTHQRLIHQYTTHQIQLRNTQVTQDASQNTRLNISEKLTAFIVNAAKPLISTLTVSPSLQS